VREKMKILKVYDTMNRAKFEAEQYYKECLDNGMNVRYITPIRFEVGENVYMFASRQAEFVGYRFNRIDDCTTCGIPDRLRACEYPIIKES
jgi:hypothetical protein